MIYFVEKHVFVPMRIRYTEWIGGTSDVQIQIFEMQKNSLINSSTLYLKHPPVSQNILHSANKVSIIETRGKIPIKWKDIIDGCYRFLFTFDIFGTDACTHSHKQFNLDYVIQSNLSIYNFFSSDNWNGKKHEQTNMKNKYIGSKKKRIFFWNKI